MCTTNSCDWKCHRLAWDDEVFSIKLAQKLSPTADDVWFWAMAVKKGTKINVIDKPLHLIYVNIERELGVIGEYRLTQVNNGQNKNDEQINNTLSYYNLYDGPYSVHDTSVASPSWERVPSSVTLPEVFFHYFFLLKVLMC